MKRTTRKLFQAAMVLMALLCAVSVVSAAEVTQGKCSSYDHDKKTISIEEYNITFTAKDPYGEPTGVFSDYNVSSALIGIPPEPGDVLRIAYEVKGTERVALKVMNVSKQDLRKK